MEKNLKETKYSVFVKLGVQWAERDKQITKAAYGIKLHNPKIGIGTKTASGNKRRVLLR